MEGREGGLEEGKRKKERRGLFSDPCKLFKKKSVWPSEGKTKQNKNSTVKIWELDCEDTSCV